MVFDQAFADLSQLREAATNITVWWFSNDVFASFEYLDHMIDITQWEWDAVFASMFVWDRLIRSVSSYLDILDIQYRNAVNFEIAEPIMEFSISSP